MLLLIWTTCGILLENPFAPKVIKKAAKDQKTLKRTQGNAGTEKKRYWYIKEDENSHRAHENPAGSVSLCGISAKSSDLSPRRSSSLLWLPTSEEKWNNGREGESFPLHIRSTPFAVVKISNVTGCASEITPLAVVVFDKTSNAVVSF